MARECIYGARSIGNMRYNLFSVNWRIHKSRWWVPGKGTTKRRTTLSIIAKKRYDCYLSGCRIVFVIWCWLVLCQSTEPQIKVWDAGESHNQTVDDTDYDSEDEVVEYFITWDRMLWYRGVMIRLSTDTQIRKKNGVINQSKGVRFVGLEDGMQREVYLILTL